MLVHERELLLQLDEVLADRSRCTRYLLFVGEDHEVVAVVVADDFGNLAPLRKAVQVFTRIEVGVDIEDHRLFPMH